MLTLHRSYSFPEEEAIARLTALTDYWHAKHGLEVRWQGDRVTLRGKVMGVKFDGDVRVGGGAVRAEVEAGFLAEKLGGRKYVEGKLDDYLDPATSLESLRARVPR